MFDLHVHTCYSLDGNEEPEEIVKYLKKKGFKGAAIVDHNTLKGALKVKSSDFLIIPGMEIKTGKGHILALGIKEEVKSRDVVELIEEIHEKGGIAVLAHPFRFSKPHCKTDAIEVINGRCFPMQNKRAMEYATRHNLPATAGSDGHYMWEMGKAYVEMNAESIDDAIEEILKGRAEAKGEQNFWHPLKCQIYSFTSFVKRGFRRVE
ncbi:MAG: PHP domain-containing protein [Thermoplasmata archaeon]|nr:MAG: PHP domain-containing protein [Thermoplasmata archaeon]